MSNAYRPNVGDLIFVSFYDNPPFLAAITGYEFDERLDEEMVVYNCNQEQCRSSVFKEAKFYPDISPDTCFIYSVVVEWSGFQDETLQSTLEYFFSPESAFKYIKGIREGLTNPPHREAGEDADYHVRVEKL